MRRSIAYIALVACGGFAQADAFRSELIRGNALVRSGDVEEALGVYRNLQVERPESDQLYYAFGCAHFEAAEQHAGMKRLEDALTAYGEARESFERARLSSAPELRRNAAFNAANCVAKQALSLAETAEYEPTLEKFKESITGYEELLREYPDLSGARINLDHMRYRLKKMLQNPPPPQQAEEDQQKAGQESSDKEGKPEEESSESKNGEDNQQKPQEDAEGEQEEQSEDRQENRAPQAESPENQGAEDQNVLEEGELTDLGDADGEESPSQSLDRRSIQAILDSLEEIDQREQKELRRGPVTEHPRKEWW